MPVQTIFERLEKKYLLSREQCAHVERGLAGRAGVDEYGESTICSLYYDSDDDRMIHTSIEKPVYKEKLRLRSYGVPQPDSRVFIEMKKKYDGVVYKRRTSMAYADATAYLSDGRRRKDNQVLHEIDWMLDYYHPTPKVLVAYDRVAMLGCTDEGLRITFDRRVRCRDCDLDMTHGDYGGLLLPEGACVMEIKAPGSFPLWLCELLSTNAIYPTSFSKYGTYYANKILTAGGNENASKRIG